MSTYTPVNPGIGGAAAALVAVSVSDHFPNTGRMLLHVHNGSGGSINVTIKDQASVAPAGASAFNGDVVVAVANGTDKFFGPFDAERFNDASGLVNVLFSSATTVTAEVIDANT